MYDFNGDIVVDIVILCQMKFLIIDYGFLFYIIDRLMLCNMGV